MRHPTIGISGKIGKYEIRMRSSYRSLDKYVEEFFSKIVFRYLPFGRKLKFLANFVVNYRYRRMRAWHSRSTQKAIVVRNVVRCPRA